MIKKYNNFSLAWGVPGFFLQFAGGLEGLPILSLLGTALLIVGFAYYAKAKGRSGAWCLVAFFGLIGMLILSCLEDREKGATDEGVKASA
jgi:hypothetical protein